MARASAVPEQPWSAVEAAFERGVPEFVGLVRRSTDPERLGAFAGRWFRDRRPDARRLLFDYLDQPLNAFRHEVLVKRLFKLAEGAGDDELLAHFLVLFDRAVRRVKTTRRHARSQVVETPKEAEDLAARWREKGFEVFVWSNWANDGTGKFVERGLRVSRRWTAEGLQVPDGSTMWRPTGDAAQMPYPIDDAVREKYEKRRRLFSLETRRYLRRRAWRYLRTLGKEHPERYVAAASRALTLYRDADAADGVALLDNWGLVHILFHHSEALVARPNGWTLAPGWGLSGLKPAPIYPELWAKEPKALFDLLKAAQSRPVRQWVTFLLRRDHATLVQNLPHEELFGLLAHHDPAVVELAVEVLRAMPDLGELGIDRLVRLVEEPNPDTIEIVAGLLSEKIAPERVSFEQAARLASSRALPTVRLGFRWLKAKVPATAEDCRALLRLAEAPCEPLRLEMVRWAAGVLGASPLFQASWVLEILDSRFEDVRTEGWAWLQRDGRVRDDVVVLRRLLESPYDDVRHRMIHELEGRAAEGRSLDSDALDDGLLRFVWAAVLLNVVRGGRTKPLVVGQLVRRLEKRPGEVTALLPILATALRSVRGPEWRAGLTGVVRLLERRPALKAEVQEAFPELKIE